MVFLQNIQEETHFIPQSLIVAALLFMSYLFISENKGQIKTKLLVLFKQKWIVAFLIYAAFLFTVTILARFTTKPIYSGVGTFRLIQNGKINGEIIFNIVLFIPYTFTYIKAFNPRKKAKTSFVLSFGSTAFIETFQFLFWVGHYTIADIVFNTFGGMVGYGIWCLAHKSKSILFDLKKR